MNNVALSQSDYTKEMFANIQRCWQTTQRLTSHVDESKRNRIPTGNKKISLVSSLLRDLLSGDPKAIEEATFYSAQIKLTRVDAYRIFSSFPLPFFYPTAISLLEGTLTQSERLCSTQFAEKVSLYLINRELSLGIKDIPSEDFFEVKKYADLTELRYILIRELCERERICPPFPEMPWLLAEAAHSISSIRSTTIDEGWTTEKTSSKRQVYEANKAYINSLKGKESKKNIETKTVDANSPEFFLHYDQIVEGMAHEISEEDLDFKKKRFLPYLAAKTAWHSSIYKDTRLTGMGMKPKKSGPKLGAKYER